MLLKASKTTLTFMLCSAFVIVSGCKSVDFGKPKLPALPKLPSLAFWKKGEDSELPPPPARHFDPSRFGGDAETQVADNGSSTRSTRADFDQYGMRIKDSAEQVSGSTTKSLASAKDSVDGSATKPMRKPYQLDDVGDDELLAKAENKFNLDTSNLKNRFNDAKTSASGQLSSAQQDFKSAMSSATSLQSAGQDALKSATNSLSGGDNSFVATPVSKAVDTAKSFAGIGGGSFSPKTGAFANVKQASADLAASTNGSLYDAQGKLRSAASKIGNQAQSLVQSPEASSLKSQFEQRLLAAQKRAEQKSDAFKSGQLKASDQLNALANVSDRTKELVSQPFPKIAADGSFVPPSSGQVASQAAKPAALQPSSPLLQISKPNTLAANSFNQNNNDSVAQMRSEVEDAKRQIALLKAEIAAAKRSVATTSQPVQRVAQNTIEGVVLPLERVNNAFDSNAGTPVANQYQGQSPAVTQPRAPNSLQYKTNSNGDSNSFYPSTPYGSFGSTQSPKGAVGQVGFEASVNEFQNRVSQANAETPVNSFSSDIPKASRIDSSTSEILIPSSILSGSSSFSPGSTTPLR